MADTPPEDLVRCQGEHCRHCRENQCQQLLQDAYELLEGLRCCSLPAKLFERYVNLRARLTALPFIIKDRGTSED